ncbi:hypothetical protein DPMN_055939 [Dreissena polymorpha]|uniref:Uncharacterized protein n=1 Tax=Dreissena polymorpha TaxID=45954 RepID=A0A9D4CSA2_DREPO|nr:hypothetical protein DPMN_055939 [Dreissena polymorpha]
MFHPPSTRVPINTASETQLRSLPGIGARTANAIINYRERVGPIDEEQLSIIPYIRMSKDLLDLIDFTPYGREFPTAQHEDIDKLSDTFHRSRLQGPNLQNAYYHTDARPQMTYADNVNMNNRFLSCDKPFFNNEYTSAGAGVNILSMTYPPQIKHPFAGYSPVLEPASCEKVRTFGPNTCKSSDLL